MRLHNKAMPASSSTTRIETVFMVFICQCEPGGAPFSRGSGQNGNQTGNCDTAPGLISDTNLAAVIRHNTLGDGQAQPRATLIAFCGIERFEDAGLFQL